jgi:hypothetical protein
VRSLSRFLLRRAPLAVLVALFVAFAALTYRDYGMTWDEDTAYTWGESLVLHWRGQANPYGVRLLEDQSAMYGNFYPAAVFAFARFVVEDASPETYHLLGLLFALPLLVAAYEVLLEACGRPGLAVLGPLFLLLVPRLLGDLPANPKDAPFAVAYFLALAGMYLLGGTRAWWARVLALGALFGLAQGQRVVALGLYPVYLGWALYLRFASAEPPPRWPLFLLRTARDVLLVGALATLLVTLGWPYLRATFPVGLANVLEYSRAFPYVGDTLYAGRHVPASDLPWHYLPVWVLVTTPLFVLVLAVAALRLLRRWRSQPLAVLLAGALAANLALYYALRPVVYDGLRHFLFLLPLLAVLAALSLAEIVGGARAGRAQVVAASVAGLVALNAALVLRQYAALHPYEYVYFNELVGSLPGADGRFETDYWGASNREAVLWLKTNLLDRSPHRVFAVHACGHPYQTQHYLPPNARWVDRLEDADYFVCFPREDPLATVKGGGRVVHTVERSGVVLNYVFEMARATTTSG